jgi:glycosyltransferase involved in cell wall biosynthesis
VKILHINQSDNTGGAAIAAHRLHQGLLAQNVSSHLLVAKVNSANRRTEEIPRNRIDSWLGCISTRLGLDHIHYTASFNIPRHSCYKQSDVLNFHNLHTTCFNYLAIPKLTRQKPAVFTHHDMWSFTGHCAYSYDCERWKTGCGRCPYPDVYKAIRKDGTWLEWRLKKWSYSRSNLTIVTPSKWLTDQIAQSMLNCFPIHHIPHGIDTNIYKVHDPEESRFLLGVPSGKRVVLFGADSLNNPRKGGDLVVRALQMLPESLKKEVVLVQLGDGGEYISKAVEMETISLGYVGGDQVKPLVYSAADVFLFPTRADNLPLMLQESMACGTPMVSFAVGGVPDLVRPGITGYLAEPGNAGDFARGVIQLLEDDRMLETMGQNCREIAVNEYSLGKQIKRYVALYASLLEG